MVIENPSALFLFIPVLLFYLFSAEKSSFNNCTEVFQGRKSLLSLAGRSLYILSISLVIFALSSPSIRNEKTRYLSPGEDYFFILDVSPSMSVRDMDGIPRIDAAKKIIADFRKVRANDCPGLILFSDEAFLSVPPTPDLNWFDRAVKDASVIYPDRGTSVGNAAALAVFYLKKSVHENRIAILLSDGISNTGTVSPGTAADAAAENRIKIYTVSIGASADETVLEMLSSATGALHFRAENKKELEYAFSFIGSLEKRERITEKVVELESLRDLLVLAAFISAVVSLFIRIIVLRELFL